MKKRPDQRGGAGEGRGAARRENTRRGEAGERPTHWGEVADWYDALVGDEGSEYHREVIMPGVLRMLGLGRGERREMRILDLACGQGVLARKLAGIEGVHVTGIDGAATLIAAAERRNAQDRLPIHYLLADATKLLGEDGTPAGGLERGSFDAITIVLAIQNISPLSPVWQGCRALLKPEGKLLLVMMHPCFRIPQRSDWWWEDGPNGGTQSRLVRQYLTSAQIAIQTHPGRAAHGKGTPETTHFHRSLQAYVNTLGNAGLLIDHLEEWISHKKSQPGPRKEALDAARREIPMFLALRARAVSRDE
ncbi:MAG TPA: class I SAM-dependent methyltransferase [Phycisphaerae bacterium]|nr:class I SAM-dependent methyltransferase [Phycisphaerae bacterium]